MNIDLTIFTPTYNRAHTLRRLYESIKNQTLHNFEWLIVDDGSTDATSIIVEDFIKDNKIKIRYIKQLNSGKQAAWNRAVIEANGRYFCNIDSDDVLYNNFVLEEIFDKYISCLKNNIIALRCLAFSKTKMKASGTSFGESVIVQKWENEIIQKKVGDRNDIWVTSILEKNLYPINSEIKFIPETWLYSNLNRNYLFAYLPIPSILIFDDHNENRLSRASIKKNAKGQYIARSCVIKSLPSKAILYNPIYFIKNLVRFSQVANYLKTPLRKRVDDVGLVLMLLSYLFVIFSLELR